MASTQVSDEAKQLATNIKIEGHEFTLYRTPQANYYSPSDCGQQTLGEIGATMEEVESVLTQLGELYPNSTLKQTIVFCEPDFYKQRFIALLQRTGSDPALWVEWSEGDEDSLETTEGRVNAFFIKIGADFTCDSDRRRFYGHELDHPLQAEISPMLTTIDRDKNQYLLLDMEGIAEADQRIGCMLQASEDMVTSTQFLAQLPLDKLVKPAEILTEGYDHKSFIADTVSRNPGYAYCFLWMYETTAEIADHLGFEGDVRQRYLQARSLILQSYQRASDLGEYKSLLKESTGFDYDIEAQNPDFMRKAQERFRKDFVPTKL